MNKPPICKPGLYLCVMEREEGWLHICEWTGEYWCYPGNYIDIASKYDQHVFKWQEMPEIKVRWEVEEPPIGSTCIVKLVDTNNNNHGYAIATYTDIGFVFTYPYEGWAKDYDDWQFVGFSIINTSDIRNSFSNKTESLI